MGGLGLPGDLSSQSRFVRAAFTRMNSVSGCTEKESVSQFFHILGSVEQQRGCCDVGDGKYEINALYFLAAMQAKAFIIIRLMKTVRSLLWICTMKPWPVRGWCAIP